MAAVVVTILIIGAGSTRPGSTAIAAQSSGIFPFPILLLRHVCVKRKILGENVPDRFDGDAFWCAIGRHA